MNKTFLRSIRPLLLIFIALNTFFITGRNWLERKGFDNEVLIVGNLVIFIATMCALILLVRGGSAVNPQGFVRAMYGSFMVRFFVILVAAFIYIMTAKKNVNKPGLVALAAVYFVYSFIEIVVLMRMMKNKKNA